MKWLVMASIWSMYCIVIAILFFFGVFSLPIFFFFFLLPILVAVISNVAMECRTYGKDNVFRFRRKIETEADRKDIFLKSLQSQINSRVFLSENNSRMIIILNSNGVYLYSFLQDVGTFFEKDSKWYLKNGKEEIEVENPILQLEQEKNRIEEFLKIEIYSCLVLDTYTHFLRGTKKYQLLNVVNAPFYLCRTNLLNRLGDEEVTKISSKISHLSYSNILEKVEVDREC